MFRGIFFSFVVLVVLTPIFQGNACSVYKTGRDTRRQKRQIVQSNVQDAIDTEQLREFFTACLTALEPEASQDWITNVDYSVLDTIWFDDNALLNCGFGLESVDCWKNNLMTYIRKYSQIFGSVSECIDFYAIDFSQNPADTSRFPTVLRQEQKRDEARSDGRREKRSVIGSQALEMYSSCITDETVEIMTDIREEPNYSSLAEFIETYTVNETCFGMATQPRIESTSISWPRRFVSFTRMDSPLRFPLQDCGEVVYPRVFPDIPRGNWGQWGVWSTCSSECGSGIRSRGRLCYFENGNRSLTSLENCDCNEAAITCARQQAPCNTLQCEPNPYYWTEWIVIRECSSTCGEGYNVEIRNCMQNSRRVSFRLCDGEHARLRTCSYPPCPRSRKFLYEPWTSWGPCSISCTTFQDRGVQTRMRCPRGYRGCTDGETEGRSCPEQLC